jgi:hypothetical protein
LRRGQHHAELRGQRLQRNAAALGLDRKLLRRPPILRGQRGVGGADSSLLVRKPGLIEIRQQPCRLAARSVKRIDRATLAGERAVVGVEQYRGLGLSDAACERLLVHAREVAPGAGEHAIDLTAHVVLEDIKIGLQGRIGRRIDVVASCEGRERSAILIICVIDHPRPVRTTAGKQRVRHAANLGSPGIARGSIGRELPERAGFGVSQIGRQTSNLVEQISQQARRRRPRRGALLRRLLRPLLRCLLRRLRLRRRRVGFLGAAAHDHRSFSSTIRFIWYDVRTRAQPLRPMMRVASHPSARANSSIRSKSPIQRRMSVAREASAREDARKRPDGAPQATTTQTLRHSV